MKTKRATTDDLQVLTGLFDQYMVFYKKPSAPTQYGAYLKERLENNEAIVFLALDNTGKALGFVLNYFSFTSVSQGKIVVLNDLFVAPSHRKKGVGEHLIQCSFDLAKSMGAVRVDLGTAKDNYDAQRLYERIGFIRDDEFYAYSYSI
ncbi:MAG: GNAT family N-acetyltransferase [Bacteroidia bacterium]|nr:GNAT family N-acetyltransferase [Bacteroidia bacterium]